ncbi:hypothetical protein [Bradyrhizobium sp. sGM-13]|uniref:hypothetical protein n=1 Tax=Bradyrhizobium sp. sGM-13 TaxID=2831781 RepID=UPI001BCDA7AE|nr:hypothetical protein [Bradyrhizobium sp. sGM-13]
MNYATAKAIAAEHAPNLIIDDEIEGQLHVCVRKHEKGPPFSITLPVSTEAMPMQPEEEATAFKGALDAAVRYLGA